MFDDLLDRVDALNRSAVDLPRLTRSRRLRLETAVIVGLAHRLATRLRRGDPIARRVRLTKGDAVAVRRCGGCERPPPPNPLPQGRGGRFDPPPLREGVGVTVPLNAAQADLDAVEAIVRAAGTSFYRGMRVLPPDRRHAMYAIYAFCRLVDDIADEDGAFAAKLPELAAWRERVAGLYHGQSDGPVTRVLVAAVQRFALRQEDFLAVIDGMQMDAETTIVAPDLATLDLYCDRVAAAVGRLSVRAFGDASPAADQVAYSLGRALQLTNILRDLQEDAERGRLYLPREWLDAAGVPHDPSAALHAPGLREVCARVAALAHEHFSDRRGGDAALRCEGDEAGTTDGRHLCRDPLAPGAPRLVAAARTRQPAGMAEALARVALRPGATLNARPCHRRRAGRSVGRGRVALSGACRHGPRGGAGRRGPVPVVFRSRAWAADRQRQPPAAVGQPVGLRLSRHDRRALDAGDAGGAGVPVRRSQQSGCAGYCGPIAAGSRGGCCRGERRMPGTHATDYLALLRLRRIRGDATVAASLRNDTLYRRLVEPLAVAALNTPPQCCAGAAAGRGDARDAVPGGRRLHPGRAARGAVGEPDRSRGRLAACARLRGA